MRILKISLLVTCFFLVLSACNTTPKSEGAKADDPNEKNASTQAEEDPKTYREPYPEYCILGDNLDVDPYSIKKHDGEIETKGRTRGDVNDPKVNSFTTTFSGYDVLKNAGIKHITIDVKAGHDTPKFTKGTFILEQFASMSLESKPLPDVMVFVSDFDKSSTFEAVMKPDAEAIKNSSSYSPDTYPSYIIEGATLVITHVEDMVLDEDEKESQKFQAKMGMVTGKQYVKGKVSFSIKKFGPKGANFGPKTFTFASINDWAYFPDGVK